MLSKTLLALAITGFAGSASKATAQERVRIERTPRAYSYSFDDNENRAVLGITTSTGSARDTLGVLVSSVTAGGPAEKAGIEEGNRISAINGVNLKLNPADVGDWDVSGAMGRRVTRGSSARPSRATMSTSAFTAADRPARSRSRRSRTTACTALRDGGGRTMTIARPLG